MTERINIFQKLLLLSAVCWIMAFVPACRPIQTESGEAANTSVNTDLVTEDKNPVKDDVSELLTIIRLPEVPEEVVWKIEPVENTNRPASTKLTAVLKYTSENTQKVILQIEKSKVPESAELGTENWFPEELIAQSQISGNESLKGTAYGVSDFVNAPYGTGKIVRVEGTNYFVVELFTD